MAPAVHEPRRKYHGVMRLSLADDHLVLDFPYDAAQVAEVRRLKGAKWDNCLLYTSPSPRD